MKKTKYLFEGSEWTVELIEKAWKVIDGIGKELGLEYNRPSIEIISSQQMLDAYSSHAMPVNYSHWSYGKSYIQNEKAYIKGQMNLAYEVVINTDPCIAYLLENNTMTMQTLVLAHAAVGHANFFKTNYLFKEWTDAKAIIPYLQFARSYIKGCEEKYGEKAVEELLDACHSIQYYGVDKYKRPPKLKKELHEQREKQRLRYSEEIFNDLWRTTEGNKKDNSEIAENIYEEKYLRGFPEENLLYFIEKKSPILKPWQKEIVRIVRKINQYFYPQYQTKLMNEGWATFIHYKIMGILYERGHISEGSYMEFLRDHTAVANQVPYNSEYYSGLNVYALGFAIFRDIERMCEHPTEEDKKHFPQICNTDSMTTLRGIVEMYRDESFIQQWLSPKVIRDFKLFVLKDNSKDSKKYIVTETQSDDDWKELRTKLSTNFSLTHYFPKIEITGVDWEDRTLNIGYTEYRDQELKYRDAKETMEHIHTLWGHKTLLSFYDKFGNLLYE